MDIPDIGIILEMIGFVLLVLHQLFTYTMRDKRRRYYAPMFLIGFSFIIIGLYFQLSIRF